MLNNPLLVGVVFIPLVGAGLSLTARRSNRLQRYIALFAMFFTVLCSVGLMADNLQDGPQIYRLGGWSPPYGIVLVSDMLAALFTVMTSIVLFGGIIYVFWFKDQCGQQAVFVPLFLTMSTGIHGALQTGDIFTLFVFLEVTVLSSVALVSISDDHYGLEAALKYLFISAMGTLFLLLGIAALYATFGTLNMADMALALGSGERPLLARAATVMLMCAFLLKSAVFPFHFWQPDFHTTAPTPVSAMLSSVVVKIGIYGILRMLTLLFNKEANTIEAWLIILGLIGIFFGSLGALRTYNAKRMLAYSTFGQIGFILVGIGWGTPLALAAAIIYAFNHAFIKSALLMLVGVVASHTKTKTAKFKDIVGAGHYTPSITGGLFFIGGLALAGLPPMNGFISKYILARSGLEAQEYGTLALAIGGGIITLLYMMRAWQLIFQRQPETTTATRKTSGGDSLIAPALLIGACAVLGIFASPLVQVAMETVQQINTPEIYIHAVGLVGG